MNWSRVSTWLEIAGGARPIPDGWTNKQSIAIARAVWWIALFVLATAFAGRNTKFVYVDF